MMHNTGTVIHGSVKNCISKDLEMYGQRMETFFIFFFKGIKGDTESTIIIVLNNRYN